jgi:hypothetical protein
MDLCILRLFSDIDQQDSQFFNRPPKSSSEDSNTDGVKVVSDILVIPCPYSVNYQAQRV